MLNIFIGIGGVFVALTLLFYLVSGVIGLYLFVKIFRAIFKEYK